MGRGDEFGSWLSTSEPLRQRQTPEVRIAELERQLAEAQKAADALRLLAVQYPVAVEQAVNIVKATLNAPRTDCPACMMGQDASKGEGTHLEGTRQHPQEPA